MISPTKINWYWHRLRAMDTAEIAGRVVEKTRAWTDRNAHEQFDHFDLGLPRPHPLPKSDAAPTALRENIAAAAARIRTGHWTLWGWKTIEVSDPPDWHLDCLSGTSGPSQGDSLLLNHRHLPNGADSRAIWEVNRWGELLTLAQNAFLTGHLEDARTAQRWLWHWCDQNPTGHGINWCSPLEVALRLLQFTWIDALIHQCTDPDLLAAQQRLAQRIVPAHAWWVWRHRSFGSSANNHLIGELASLIVAAHRWPSLSALGACSERAAQRLETEILRQFAPDGGNREQALHYHLFALELCLHALHVQRSISPEVAQRLAAAQRFFVAMAPHSAGWDFGDSDDGIAVCLSPSLGYADWHQHFTSPSEPGTVNYWLGDNLLHTQTPTVGAWQAFPDSGMASVRRSGWMARLDASPLGLGSMAAHGHLDALHLSLWWQHHALLIDPGTGAYYADPALRNQLSGWQAHNGPQPVTSRPVPQRMGTFLWSQHHRPPLLELHDSDAVACFACDGPFVKRRVVVRDSQVDVLDEVSTPTPHQVVWQFAPEWTLAQLESQLYRLTRPDATPLLLRLDSSEAITLTETRPVVSRRFGVRENAPALQVNFVRSLRTRLTQDGSGCL